MNEKQITFVYSTGTNRDNPARGPESLDLLVRALEAGGHSETDSGGAQVARSASPDAGKDDHAPASGANAGHPGAVRQGRSAETPLGRLGRLIAYARANQLVLMGPFYRRLANDHTEIGSGAEHIVFDHPKANRVIKLTHADELGYGDFVCSYDALDYIRSLFLGNVLLGMDTRFEGIVRLEASLPQLVTSQTRVEFAREASKRQIAGEMKRRGFYFDTAWWMHPIGVKISDAVPNNVLIDGDGRFHFIDVYIQITRPIAEIVGDLAAA